MKYIRTKNGEIHEFLEEGINNAIISTKGCVIMKYAITKQADTIEELCDEFIHNNQLLNPYYIDPKDTELIAFRNRLEYEFKEKNHKEIYGAIWTDKGLIYVAKMNEKGEFELL